MNMFKLINKKDKQYNTHVYGIQLLLFRFMITYTEFAGHSISFSFMIHTFKLSMSIGNVDSELIDAKEIQSYDA